MSVLTVSQFLIFLILNIEMEWREKKGLYSRAKTAVAGHDFQLTEWLGLDCVFDCTAVTIAGIQLQV
jgi:hypothetical protein